MFPRPLASLKLQLLISQPDDHWPCGLPHGIMIPFFVLGLLHVFIHQCSLSFLLLRLLLAVVNIDLIAKPNEGVAQ